MAQPELNLITAASMGNLAEVKRLMQLELPGGDHRQTMVFAALKDRWECIEVLIPICDQTAINDSFSFSIQENHFQSATVLLPHVFKEELLDRAVVGAVAQHNRRFFNLVLPHARKGGNWLCVDESLTDRLNVPLVDRAHFWTWFYEEDSLRQKEVLKEVVGEGATISAGRKI